MIKITYQCNIAFSQLITLKNDVAWVDLMPSCEDRWKYKYLYIIHQAQKSNKCKLYISNIIKLLKKKLI